jgi:hypothetical protein
VTIRGYLALYGLAVFELHEAFHGLHPGIALIHGHKAFRVEIAYGGIPGNVLFVGRALEDVHNLGDILDRLNNIMGMDEETRMLAAERACRGCEGIAETNVAAAGEILVGRREDRVGTIIHIFPHGGFSPQHLEKVKSEHPEADTVLASISRVRSNSPLVAKCKELNMNFIIGNSHALEILENGLPLAVALQKLLPQVEVVLFRERITATPLAKVGTASIRDYAEHIASRYLVPQGTGAARSNAAGELGHAVSKF